MDKKILIVDDSPDWVNSHLAMLDELYPESNISPDIKFCAKDAYEHVINSGITYDLIISDMEMERILGERFAGEWLIKNLKYRDECSSTKLLIISGAYDIEDIARRLNVDYIPKSSLLGNPLLLKYKIDEL